MKTLNKCKRIVNRKLLDDYQGRACLICMTSFGTTGHHIKTKKTGGHDLDINLMPLCAEHHQEIHRIGTRLFAEKYVLANLFLRANGWEYAEGLKKWLNPNAHS